MLIETQSIAIKKTIPEAEWKEKKTAHEQRVDELLNDYLQARSRQEKNPVMDFLFEYYAFRPANLRKWSPGIGIELEYSAFDQLPEISEFSVRENSAYVDPVFFPKKRISSLKWMLQMLKNTQSSRPSFGCFGMHEWAMVYKTDKPRHNQVPLRMEPEKLADFVESRPLLCTHYDAFRFFTKPAQPMNRFELSREKFHETEQPGCIHSNMDLYKWAFKIYPFISSNLILEAFELAVEARRIDMQASPYDLREQGLQPIKIESESGRKEYKKKQEMIFEKGFPFRNQVIKALKDILLRVES